MNKKRLIKTCMMGGVVIGAVIALPVVITSCGKGKDKITKYSFCSTYTGHKITELNDKDLYGYKLYIKKIDYSSLFAQGTTDYSFGINVSNPPTRYDTYIQFFYGPYSIPGAGTMTLGAITIGTIHPFNNAKNFTFFCWSSTDLPSELIPRDNDDDGYHVEEHDSYYEAQFTSHFNVLGENLICYDSNLLTLDNVYFESPN